MGLKSNDKDRQTAKEQTAGMIEIPSLLIYLDYNPLRTYHAKKTPKQR
jgi:hypothetical protein